MKAIEIYLQSEFYNPRVKATIPGAWVVVLENDIEIPVAPTWKSKEQAVEAAAKAGFGGLS